MHPFLRNLGYVGSDLDILSMLGRGYCPLLQLRILGCLLTNDNLGQARTHAPIDPGDAEL